MILPSAKRRLNNDGNRKRTLMLAVRQRQALEVVVLNDQLGLNGLIGQKERATFTPRRGNTAVKHILSI
jgi:hypothetical protein